MVEPRIKRPMSDLARDDVGGGCAVTFDQAVATAERAATQLRESRSLLLARCKSVSEQVQQMDQLSTVTNQRMVAFPRAATGRS